MRYDYEYLESHHWVVKEWLDARCAMGLYILMEYTSVEGRKIIHQQDHELSDVINGECYLGWSCETYHYYVQHYIQGDDIVITYQEAVDHLTEKIMRQKQVV